MENTGISTARQAASQEARSARGVAGQSGSMQGGKQAAAPGDGFASLLASLGQDAGAGAGLQEVLPGVAAAVADAPAPPAGVPDVAALLPWMTHLQPAAMPAQLSDAGSTQGVDALAGRMGLGLVRPGQDSLVGQTALLDGAAEAAALNGTAQADGLAAPMGRAGAARAQPWRGVEAAQGAGDAGRGLATAHKATAQASAAGPDQAAVTTAAAPQGTGQTASAAGMEQRPGHSPLAVEPQARTEADPAVPALAAGAMDRAPGAGTGAGQQRLGDAPATREGGLLGPERSTQQGPDGTTADAAQAAWDGASDGPAEQVTYWMQHNTQNAELTLDRDGQPVQVQVALTGDQAHVNLRSDQLEARQLLDAGRAQLQDMLAQQGLQLAGMTVGTGGGHGAQADQDGREPRRQGAQRASVPVAPMAGAALRRGQGASERGVDIFV